MSIAEVQQRVATIEAHLTGQAAAPAASQVDFAALLRSGPPPTAATARSAAASPAARSTATATAAGSGPPAAGGEVVERAKQYLGTPYVWGGETPDGGFDCSGLVQHVFGQSGVDLPRVSTDQARAGAPVPVEELAAGDLVFFGRPVDHVGIYAGDGTMVVSPRRGDVVKVQKVNLASITAARRVLPDQATVPAGGPGTARTLGVDGPAPGSARALGTDAAGLRGLPPQGRQYAGAIERAAEAAGVDPKLVAAVAWTESGFRPDAVSRAGATGLMQLMPATARGLGADPLDPVQNLDAGARYLAAQLARFGRADLALAAYNAGPTAVVRAGGIPPYPETQAYVARVLERMEEL